LNYIIKLKLSGSIVVIVYREQLTLVNFIFHRHNKSCCIQCTKKQIYRIIEDRAVAKHRES